MIDFEINIINITFTATPDCCRYAARSALLGRHYVTTGDSVDILQLETREPTLPPADPTSTLEQIEHEFKHELMGTVLNAVQQRDDDDMVPAHNNTPAPSDAALVVESAPELTDVEASSYAINTALPAAHEPVVTLPIPQPEHHAVRSVPETVALVTTMTYETAIKHVHAQQALVKDAVEQIRAAKEADERERQRAAKKQRRGKDKLTSTPSTESLGPGARTSFGSKGPLPSIKPGGAVKGSKTKIATPTIVVPAEASMTESRAAADATAADGTVLKGLAAPELSPGGARKKLSSMYDVVASLKANHMYGAAVGTDEDESDGTAAKALAAMQTTQAAWVGLVPVVPVVDGEHERDVAAAIDVCRGKAERVVESDTARSSTHYQLGALLRHQGRLAEAMTCLDVAIEANPLNFDAYWQRHLVYIAYSDNERALKDLHVLSTNVKWPQVYRSRADIHYFAKQYDEAIYNYQTALLLRSEDWAAYYRRAMCRLALGETMLAVQDFESVLKFDRFNIDALRHLGRHYFTNKRYERCIRTFDDIACNLPRDVEVYFYKAQCYEALEQFHEALHCFCQAIHLDPSNHLMFTRRGMLLRNVHPRRAIEDLSLSILLNDNFDNIIALMHRGLAYTHQRQFAAAVADFQAVIRRESLHRLTSTDSSPHVWSAIAACQIGLVYLKESKEYLLAIKAFTRSLQCDPTYVRALICRAQAYHRLHQQSDAAMGYLRRAVADYTRAMHLKPGVSELYVHRGKLLLEAGQGACMCLWL